MNIVSTGQLKAQSFSVQVSTRTKCNAGCKFCISRITPGTKGDEEVYLCDLSRLIVGLGFAERLGCTHGILTGRADPLQEDLEYLCSVIGNIRDHLPLCDMHTNGYVFQKRLKGKADWFLEKLVDHGLTMITYSIAHYNTAANHQIMGIEIDPSRLINFALEQGLLVRCSVVMSKSGIKDFNDVYNYIKFMGHLGVHMVVIRDLWAPDLLCNRNEKVWKWNKDNYVSLDSVRTKFEQNALDYEFLRNHLGAGSLDSVMVRPLNSDKGIRRLEDLPWGQPVFSVEGCFVEKTHAVNVTFANCGEGSVGPVMKSIVHKPDGHGFRNWDTNGSILY